MFYKSSITSPLQALLQEDEDLQAIHSTKSVTAMLLKAAKEKIQEIQSNNSVHPKVNNANAEPKVIGEVS